ncbi:MAG: tetratricopeptide repeat protein [Burkholderiales bacterium]
MNDAKQPMRNDPCPCGSGRRYKYCHGRELAIDATIGTQRPLVRLHAPVATEVSAPMDAVRVALREGRPEDALRLLGQVEPDMDPRVSDRLRAEALRTIDPKQSRITWENILAEKPGDPEALFFIGDLDREAGLIESAITRFEAALVSAPDHPSLLNNLGLALEKCGRFEEAEARFNRALEVAPDDLNALANLAQNHYQQRRDKEAILEFRRLLAAMPDAPAAIRANLGVCLRRVGNPAGAEPHLVRATELAPNSPGPWRDLGSCRIALNLWNAAAFAYARAIELDPDDHTSGSMLLHSVGHECLWDGLEVLRGRIVDSIVHPKPDTFTVATPFPLQALSDDPWLERDCASSWTRCEFLPTARERPRRRASPARLRVGFVSPDFHRHPVGRLVVGPIERLDRERFDVYTYACRISADDDIRRRIVAASSGFRYFPEVDARELASAIRSDGIDILVDLTGHTADANISTFSLRPAPVQVSFLGYTGTIGSAAYDWIVADPYCIPRELASAYVERVLYLEPCYLPPCGDSAAPETPARTEYQLPDDAIVFSAMSSMYKILPERFAAWVEILGRVPDSVLWMRAGSKTATQRLQARARALGIEPGRIVFARSEPVPRYLARYRLADLYLDSWPFGSHTTVNDALSVGLPVLSQAGRSFASRASSSQIVAAGLAELVATDLTDYVSKAVALGLDRDRLASLRARLSADRAKLPYFSQDSYARALGAALERAWAETPAD